MEAFESATNMQHFHLITGQFDELRKIHAPFINSCKRLKQV